MSYRGRSGARHLGANQRAISRREVLRIGGLVIPASVMLPAWMTAQAQTTTTFDYYISTTGSDSNAGTLAAPWALTSLAPANGTSQSSANNKLMAGKRIGLLPGTYTVPGSWVPTGGSGNNYPILVVPPGTSSASTYLGSSNTSGQYQRGTATVQWAAGASVGSNSALLGLNPTGGNWYATFDGLAVNGNGAVPSQGMHLISFNGTTGGFSSPGTSQGAVVQYCEIYGISNGVSGDNDAGVWFSGTDGAIVQNCYIHDISKPSQPDHCHGIEGYSMQNCQFIYNTYANCTGGACETKVGGIGNTCAYSYFYNCTTLSASNEAVMQGWDGGENMSGSTPFLLHHNVIDSCGRSCYGEYYNNTHHLPVYWYNNTIYANAHVGAGGVASGNVILEATGPFIQHYNNVYVIINASSVSGFAQFTSGDTNPMGYDWVYVPSGSASGAFSGGVSGDPIGTADPQFSVGTANIVAGNGPSQFQLAAGSPCIGAGRVGGTASGAVCNSGAWDGTVTQIGASWTSGAGSPPLVPNPATLSVS
jgi:hypothetical protein